MGRRNRKDEDGNLFLFKNTHGKRKSKPLPKRIAHMSWDQKMRTLASFEELVERGNDQAYAAKALTIPLEMFDKWKADRAMVEAKEAIRRRAKEANAI